MINILHFLFFLAISPARGGSIACGSSQCCWVVLSWKAMGRTTTVDTYHPTACCRKLGSTTQPSGIPGVICSPPNADAGTGMRVTQLYWRDQSLTGKIPAFLNNLKYLQEL